MSRRGAGLVVALAAVGGLVIGGAIGFIPPLASAPGFSPRPPIRLPAGFPDGSERYLAGFSITPLMSQEKSGGYDCESQTPHLVGAKSEVSCSGDDRTYFYSVTFDYDDANHVREVNASCTIDVPQASQAGCRTLASGVARQVFAGDPGLAGQAAAWASQNTGQDAATTIGSVYMRTTLGTFLVADFTPAG